MKISSLFIELLMLWCLLVLNAFAEDDYRKESPSFGLSNPAAIYCTELGYKFELVEEDAGTIGLCVFPEGQTCNAWEFLSGKCGAEYSFCARQGLVLEVHTDGLDCFTPEYAVCINSLGQELGRVTDLTKLQKKASAGFLSAPSELQTQGGADAQVVSAEMQAEFDWRNRPEGNFLTNIRDQGNCGSCWAFSVVGVTEAQLNIASGLTGNNFDLSEQYLVSTCCGAGDCGGGFTGDALDFIRTSGIPDEACMPYLAQNSPCETRCGDWETRLIRLVMNGTVAADRNAIKNVLVSKGPLSASLFMGGGWDAQRVYRCSDDSPHANHAVVLVGYNDADAYWVVRNSWGATWNGDGYFRVGYDECRVEQGVLYGTLTGVPTPDFPRGAIATMRPRYRWTSVGNAAKYEIQAYRGRQMIDSQIFAPEACSGHFCSAELEKVLEDGNYRWRIRAYADEAWRPFSAYCEFNVSSALIMSVITPLITQSDLPTVMVHAYDSRASEPGTDIGGYELTRSGDLSSKLVVKYSVRGTAIPGKDYKALPGKATIPAGKASVRLKVIPIDDDIGEPIETVILELIADPNYAIGTPKSAKVTIRDDDL